MSTLLLYSKEFLNRTLTRSLLFALAQLLACVIVSTQAISPAEAIEPLSVKTANPRYFFDSKGNPVYLTGSYLNQYNTLSGSRDFAAYLDSLQEQNQNFTRMWGWEQSPWIYDTTGQISFASQPYERTGPGLALDGGLKFDLTRFDQAYFDQLRSRVVQAAQRGIYVSVMLFEGFSTQKKLGRVNPWLGDPLQQLNNINGINGDPNRNGSNEELFSLAYPSLLALQEAFVRKVVDTLNDLDNVLYEINGNGLSGSLSWQYQMIDYVKRYQKKTSNQRPVGISDFYAGVTAEVLNSAADWIVINETNSNPPPATTKKIVIVEGTPPVSIGEPSSALPISLFQLVPDNIVSSQSSNISNNVSSNGITLLSSSATSSTPASTQNSSNSQQSQVTTPTIAPNGGVYSTTVAVTLETTTLGASIYYTTDGQSPTQSSQRYSGKFKVSGSTLVKAKAFKSNFDPSSEASAWFANAASPSASGSGLVAHWKFDEGKGTSAADSSGNGNKGALVGRPVWTAGKIGNALSFDGINDNVTVADSNSLDLSSSFTLSAWVNPASTFTDFRSILVKNYTYYLYASVAGHCGDGSPLAGGFTGATDQILCQPSPLPINTWTHLAATYNGSTLTLYRDGVVVATSTASGTLSPTTGTLQIGGSQFGEYFKGLIDEVRIYNKALSATEIQTVYQQDSATPVQTVATPAISPGGGSFSNSVPVTMQTATSGASIYYTTDGSTPTQSSTMYAGTVTLTNSTTVKAKAFKNGANPSAEASAAFTVTQPFSFSLANSGDKSVNAGSSVTNSISTALTSGNAQTVTLSASGLPTGATASFSSASCSPSCSSTLTINTTASTPAASSTITVTASGGGITKTTTFGLNVSAQTVAMPVISPNGGNFTNSAAVTMQTATSGASIHYTTDGSTPTQSSTMYAGTVTLTKSATMKAKAFKSPANASVEASASFTVTQPFSFSLANSGDKSVNAGSSVTNSIGTTLTSGSAQPVTLSASGLPTGATSSFSSATCSPSCSSTLTINTTASTPAASSTITVTASGGGITKTTSFSLNVSAQTVATPVISPNGGNFTNSAAVTMQTATSGASIYYTADGSTPTQSSTLYNGAVTLTSTAVVKAKAFKNGYNASTEANASFIVTPAGLVAYWKFDQGSGTSAADASGNGNNGTLVNGPLWTAGRVGNALSFDGINDNVTVADSNSLDLSSSFTLSAWVNPASTFTDFRSILVKNYTYYLYASVAGHCGDGSPLAGGFTGATDQILCQPSPLPINTWTHLAATYDGSTLTFYRDGVVAATSSASGTLSPTTGTLQIGGSQFGEYFKGLIDEVRIYNRALNVTEIQAIYQQDSGVASQTVTPVIPNVNQPFSFSLSNSGDKSVVAGSSATNSIATALVSGSSQTVSFIVSGLPSGATGSFSSTSCTPACSTVLNISTSGSTPAGNFPITITSTGGGVTRTTAFTLSVTSVVATPTKGATYWANTNGTASCAQAQSATDPGPGRYRKLRDALGCLGSGDTLIVKPGNYLTSADNFLYSDFANGTPSQYTTIKCEVAKQCIFLSDGYQWNMLTWTNTQRYIEVNGIVIRSKFMQLFATSLVNIQDGNFHSIARDGIPSCYNCGPTNIRFINGEFDGPCDVQDCNQNNYGPNCFLGGVPFLEFINMEVHNCNYGYYWGGSDSLIESNWIHHNVGFAVHMYCNPGGGIGCGDDFHPIDNNIVRNNLMEYNASMVPNAGGLTTCMSTILLADGDNRQVYNNVIRHAGFGNATSGASATCGGGIVIFSGARGDRIFNNTIYGTHSGATYNSGGSSGTTWQNNIVWGTNLGGFGCPGDPGGCEYQNDGGAPGITLNNNMYQSGSAVIGSFSGSGNTFGQNPNITSSTDPRLQSGSPAINTGTNLSSFFTTDAAGTSRPQAGAWDRGACEWFSGAGVCPSLNVVRPSPAN